MNKEVKLLLNEFVFVTLYAWSIIVLFHTAQSLEVWQTALVASQNAISSTTIFAFLLWVWFAVLPSLNTGMIGNPSFVLHAVFTGEAQIYQVATIALVDIFAYILALFILPSSYTFPAFPLPAISPSISLLQGVFIEAGLTFGLVFSCTYFPRVVKIAPAWTISTVIVSLIYTGAPFTGAWMNPSSVTATSLLYGNYSQVWVYWVGPLLGAALSGLLFHILVPQVHSSQVHSSNEQSKKTRQGSDPFISQNHSNSQHNDQDSSSGTVLQPVGRENAQPKERRKDKKKENRRNNAEEQRQQQQQRQEDEAEREKKSREEKKAAKKKLKQLKESTRKTHTTFTKSAAPAAPRRIAPVMQPGRRG